MKVVKIPTGQLNVNTYYVIDENTNKGFLVDPGGYSASLAKRIKDEKVTIEYIILTHGHSDHIGGVEGFLKEFPNAKLVASKYEKEMLEDAEMNFSNYFRHPTVLTPDIYAEDGDVLSVGDLTLKLIHTPGHSPGGMCILTENVLFSGDTLFQQSIGRTDFVGSSFDAIKKSIHEKLFTLPDDTKVFPGHMGETEIGFEKRNNPFV